MIPGYPWLLAPLALAVAVLLGCSSTATLPAPEDVSTKAAPGHALIYIIHGDGSYLYHADGVARQADQEALAEARLVAEHAPNTEVFIFHQRPRRSFLGLFPRSDGTFYHYRDGVLLAEGTYQRDPSGAGLSAEAALYYEHRHPDTTARSLLYFGHDLEERGGAHYHASHPEHPFGLQEFTEGLTLFGAEEGPFDLVVLSTCNNGTPATVAALAPLTRFVLASPGNLHLSHVDSHPLHRAGTAEDGMEELAPTLAEWAYTRLARRTETTVTLTLYDTDRLASILPELREAYKMAFVGGLQSTSTGLNTFVDCGSGLLPGLEDAVPGVQPWYRPPSFGPGSQNDSHSGWGCPQTAAD